MACGRGLDTVVMEGVEWDLATGGCIMPWKGARSVGAGSMMVSTKSYTPSQARSTFSGPHYIPILIEPLGQGALNQGKESNVTENSGCQNLL